MDKMLESTLTIFSVDFIIYIFEYNMKDDNYIRQKIIELYFDKHLSIAHIKYMVDKSEDFIERVIIKHSDYIRKQ